MNYYSKKPRTIPRLDISDNYKILKNQFSILIDLYIDQQIFRFVNVIYYDSKTKSAENWGGGEMALTKKNL